MALALFSMAMFFAMTLATIHALRNESRERAPLSAAADLAKRK